MPNIAVQYRYERPQYLPANPANEAQLVHRAETQRIVVNVAMTTVTTRDGTDTRPTPAAIITALNAAGVGSTGPGGMSLVVEGYSAA